MRRSIFLGLWVSSLLIPSATHVAAQTPPAKPYTLNVNNDADAKAVLNASEPPRLRVEIGRATDAPWKVQLSVPIGPVKANTEYTLKIRWRSDKTRTVFVVATIDTPPWTGVGLAKKFSVGPEWKEENISFKSTGEFPNARVKFDLGAEAIPFEIESMAMTSPGMDQNVLLDARALTSAPKPQPTVPPAKQMSPPPPQPVQGWKLQAVEGTIARLDPLKSPADPLRVQVDKVLELPWQVSVDYKGLSINKDEACEIRFKAKGTTARVAGIGVGLAEKPWTSLGLYKKVDLTTELKEFSLPFKATDSSKNARILIDLGHATGGIEMTELAFVTGKTETKLVGGNAPSQTPEAKPLMPSNENLPSRPSPQSDIKAKLVGWSFDVLNPAAARCHIVKSDQAHLQVTVAQTATQDSVRAALNFEGIGAARVNIKGAEGKSVRCSMVADSKVIAEKMVSLVPDWTPVEFLSSADSPPNWSIVVELGDQPGETSVSAAP